MSKADDVLKEMERIAKAFQAPDQILELDMQKVINTLRSEAKLGKDQIEAIDFAMHNPDKLKWTRVVLPEAKNDYVPTDYEVKWFRDFTAEHKQEVWEWQVVSTGQRYRFNNVDKTVTLIRETPDPNDWHSRNKKILSMLGWKMVDPATNTRTFNAQHGTWTLSVLDFPIDAQENPNTPSRNFPAGTHGQDAMANNGSGVVVRLGHNVGRWFIKHASVDFGIGKSVTFGS